jgi:N-methylhydantoinase B
LAKSLLTFGSVTYIICMHIMNVTRVIRYMNLSNYHAKDIGIYEGDEFINNDAYIGGMHVPDIGIVSPVFYQKKHIGYVAGISHTTEVGAIELGGMSPLATEAVHDGIHLPAVKLVERGLMRRDVMGCILRQVRDSTSVELDIRARLGGNERARRRILELIDDVGMVFFNTATKKLLDDAEAFARDRIKTLKPGIYRARVFDENCGLKEKLAIIQVEMEVTKNGDLLIRVPVISPENRSFDNAYLPAVEATAFYVILDLLLYDCRWNTGLARAIKIEYVPERSRLNASPNASVAYATVGIAAVFKCCLMDAVARALFVSGRPDDVVAPTVPICGTPVGGPNRQGVMQVNILSSSSLPKGGGARIDRDGIDSTVTMFNPWSYIPDTESEETIAPVMHLIRRHRPNSGGFGKFRGGTGTENVTMVYNCDEFTLTHYGSGRKIPSNQGLFGGYPGPASIFDYVDGADPKEVLEKIPKMARGEINLSQLKTGHYHTGAITATTRDKTMRVGDVFHSSTHSGAGGLGDPMERDPAMVVEDIRNKHTTADVSSRVYAVAMDAKTLEVDLRETERLRAARRAERRRKGLPGIQYLRKIVAAREKKELPEHVVEFFAETIKFTPSYATEFEREKRIATAGLPAANAGAMTKKLFSLTPYVDIMTDEQKRKWAVCSKCGHVYCEAKDNFKLYALIHDSDPADYLAGRDAYDKEWCVFREFYCPGCLTQVEVEATVPGGPILWNYELDELKD